MSVTVRLTVNTNDDVPLFPSVTDVFATLTGYPTAITNVVLTDPGGTQLSVAVSRTVYRPMSATAGVPLKVRVAALKLSQAGSADPSLSVAPYVKGCPSASAKVFAGNAYENATVTGAFRSLIAVATVGARFASSFRIVPTPRASARLATSPVTTRSVRSTNTVSSASASTSPLTDTVTVSLSDPPAANVRVPLPAV